MTDNASPDRGPIQSELLRENPTFADIVIPFVEGLSERLRVMEQSIRGTDFETLKVAAHQLKGAGGGYGFPILTERAAKLEQFARQGAVEDCANLLAELKDLVARIELPPQEG
ncbi:MAG TPA: Hpt domain-containing protein [Phycisphaerae bacterium]|nr:Hpt domain-containing protein [Phycisphaerae bacterium]HNU46005.1 Hpt domain-containing protein [Phycisphaerae bacterium]